LYEKVMERIRIAGGTPYISGGYVRDLVMFGAATKPKDVDVEVFDIDIPALENALAAFGKLDYVGNSFGVLKLKTLDGVEYDISLPRRETKTGVGHKGFTVELIPNLSLLEAVRRRDYSMNALMLNPFTGEILDLVGGINDIRNGVLRHVSEHFGEDPLRVLRAMQFAACFNFKLAPETATLCQSLVNEYATLPIERKWGEWEKFFLKGRKPSAGLKALEASGWLIFYMELTAMQGLKQNPDWHPEGDVWTHTLQALDTAADIAARDKLQGDNRIVLILAVLCHDMGKASTTISTNDKIISHGHATAGEIPARSFMTRIGSPYRFIMPVTALVKYHMDHISVTEVNERQVRRLSAKLGTAGTNLSMLARVIESDHSGTGLPKEVTTMLEIAERLAVKDQAPKPILMGRHLVELKLPPGPLYSKVLGEVFEAQLDGKVTNLDDTTEYAKRLLANEKQPKLMDGENGAKN